MMLREPVTIPSSEQDQLRELNRLLQLRSCVNSSRRKRAYRIAGDGLSPPQRYRPGHAARPGAVMLVPEKQHLTTQRAADMLGVSRPHLIKLLHDGDLPYHTVGSHRRVYLNDVLTYVRRRDAERHEALNALAKEAFAAGLYEDTGIPEGGSDECAQQFRSPE